jgi:glycerophosphoryl diester phosphodiesterase
LPKPLVIAHRGITSLAIENSLKAFGLAVENSTPRPDGVELDVHSTADGKIVVHHDPTLPSGRPIATLALDRVLEERLADGQEVPTLEQALDVLGELRVFVEVKGVAPEADDALIGSLRGGPHPGRYQIHGFDHRVIARLARQAPWFGYGVLSTSYPISPVSPVIAAGASTLWQDWRLVDRVLVERCAEREVEVIAWTCRNDQEVRTMAALGVAGVCVDL